MSDVDPEEEKQQRLAEFHERNQQFLSQSHNNSNMHRESNHDVLHLNKQILELQLQVQQLTHELETTREAYHLSSDKCRAEVALLQSQIEHENSRHEKIIASLRDQLVESELERMKMQDQLRHSFETKSKDEDELKHRWMEMASRIEEEKKWVDEQMDHWKESMEGRRSKLNDAKMRGALDAGVADDSDNRAEKAVEETGRGKTSVSGRRSRQRRLWGKADFTGSKDDDNEEEEDDDDDDDDSECDRIFGNTCESNTIEAQSKSDNFRTKVLTSWKESQM